METKNQLFSMVEPSKNLKISILNKIKLEEMKMAIYKKVFSSVASLASVSLAIIFIIDIIKDAYQSGLSEYLSLLFSDGASLISYWQSYAMSIIESLPILQITIVFASIWVFAWSLSTVLSSQKSIKSISYKTI